MSNISFGFIGEGVTDYLTIRGIISIFYNDDDISVNPLQPEASEDDKQATAGNWLQVFNYCKTERLKEAFDFNDYIIIQIDTDVCHEKGYDIPYNERDDSTGKKLRENVIKKFKEEIFPVDLRVEEYLNKIIFAITIHSTECWFLPIYYTDNKKSKMVNCLGTLNLELAKKEGFTIDSKNKNHDDYYRKITAKFGKKKDLIKHSKHNYSFDAFINSLPALS